MRRRALFVLWSIRRKVYPQKETKKTKKTFCEDYRAQTFGAVSFRSLWSGPVCSLGFGIRDFSGAWPAFTSSGGRGPNLRQRTVGLRAVPATPHLGFRSRNRPLSHSVPPTTFPDSLRSRRGCPAAPANWCWNAIAQSAQEGAARGRESPPADNRAPAGWETSAGKQLQSGWGSGVPRRRESAAPTRPQKHSPREN